MARLLNARTLANQKVHQECLVITMTRHPTPPMIVMIYLISYLLSLMYDFVTLASRSPSLPPLSAAESRTPTPLSQDPNPHSDQNANRQVVPRSRWQSVLLEAGGIGAAVSEESMRRLKYCLQWLQVRALTMSMSI